MGIMLFIYGGCVILTQVVLAQLGVYWAHLYQIPMAILKSINCIIANFIWSGCNDSHKIHLAKMTHI